MFVKEHGRDARRFSRDAVAHLMSYPWPGNVRELRNVIESVVVFHRGDEIRAADLPPEVRAFDRGVDAGALEEAIAAAEEVEASPPPRNGHDEGRVPEVLAFKPAPAAARETKTMADIEREAILATLEKTGGRRVEAARLLDIGLRTLQRKLKEYKDQGRYEEPS
jgi:DNA-binding NtrC family response regulator